MNHTSTSIKRTYYILTLLTTLAASFIWGINTIFLLDAGLSNTEAFAANAFYTLGMVIFEVPTGIFADTRGRKLSFVLGTLTLALATLAYFWLWHVHGPFWAWIIVSMFLGLGFSFFSGATEAWLVDALKFTGSKDSMESVFGKGQAIGGAAMLVGSISGGLIAQATNLGVPYIVRAVLLCVTFIIAMLLMRDLGFAPEKGKSIKDEIVTTFKASIEHGWKQKSVRWMLLTAPFGGVGIFVFYVTQPYLLQLIHKPDAYAIAGLVAAIVAGAQIVGGLLAGKVRLVFKTRTGVLMLAGIVNVIAIVLLGLIPNFWAALTLTVFTGLTFALVGPVRQAYLNGLIPSEQRATVLSFDSLLDSAGGAVTQPALGRVADSHGYGASYLVSAVIEAGALPFLLLARRRHAQSDPIKSTDSVITPPQT